MRRGGVGWGGGGNRGYVECAEQERRGFEGSCRMRGEAITGDWGDISTAFGVSGVCGMPCVLWPLIAIA